MYNKFDQEQTGWEMVDQSGSFIYSKFRFPNPVIAESALDRLVSCAHVITLTGKSYRSLLRPNKDLDKEVVTV